MNYPQEYLDYQAGFYNADPESFHNLTLDDYMFVVKTGLDHSVRHNFIKEVYNFPSAIYYIDRIFEYDTNNPYGTCTLTTKKVEVQTKLEPLGFDFDKMCQVLLVPEINISPSVKKELLNAIGIELALARDYRALGSLIYSIKDKEVEPVNFDEPRNIVLEIDRVGGKLYMQAKRGIINTILVTPKAFVKIKMAPQYMPSEGTSIREGIYQAGTLCGMKIFVCPSDSTLLKDGEVLFMYKSPDDSLDNSIIIRNEAELRGLPSNILGEGHRAECQTVTLSNCFSILGKIE